jgi:hypothetical protein
MPGRDDPPPSAKTGSLGERRRARAAEALRANLRRRKAARKLDAPDDKPRQG